MHSVDAILQTVVVLYHYYPLSSGICFSSTVAMIHLLQFQLGNPDEYWANISSLTWQEQEI